MSGHLPWAVVVERILTTTSESFPRRYARKSSLYLSKNRTAEVVGIPFPSAGVLAFACFGWRRGHCTGGRPRALRLLNSNPNVDHPPGPLAIAAIATPVPALAMKPRICNYGPPALCRANGRLQRAGASSAAHPNPDFAHPTHGTERHVAGHPCGPVLSHTAEASCVRRPCAGDQGTVGRPHSTPDENDSPLIDWVDYNNHGVQIGGEVSRGEFLHYLKCDTKHCRAG